MRIVLITQGINPIFNLLLKIEDHKLIGVIEDAPRKQAKHNFFSKLRSVLSQTKSLRARSVEYSIPYIFHNKKTKGEVVKWVEDLAPDLIIVYSMSRLLSPSIFMIPIHGTINIHPGILPEYKGRNPWIALYANYDLNPGITIHFIDAGEDTGDIICQRHYQILPGEQVENAEIVAIDLACKMLIDTISKFQTKRIEPVPQLKDDKFFCERYESNIGVINWENWEVKRVWHFLKGTQLWGIPVELPDRGILRYASWSIGKISHLENLDDPSTFGRVVKSGNLWVLKCKGGLIELKYSFGVKKVLKKIFVK